MRSFASFPAMSFIIYVCREVSHKHFDESHYGEPKDFSIDISSVCASSVEINEDLSKYGTCEIKFIEILSYFLFIILITRNLSFRFGCIYLH